jgi:hypothetical protein
MQSSSRMDTQFSAQNNKVYVLFRVFGLRFGDIDVKVFVDPVAARNNGLLEFEPESWLVTAKTPSSFKTPNGKNRQDRLRRSPRQKRV